MSLAYVFSSRLGRLFTLVLSGLLLQSVRGAEPGAADLLNATRDGDLEALAAILDAKPGLKDAKSASKRSAVIEAVTFEQTEALKLLLERGADPNVNLPKSSHTALYFAASSGQMEAVKLLLAHGAEVNPAIPRNAKLFARYSPLGGACNIVVATPRGRRFYELIQASAEGGASFDPEKILTEEGEDSLEGLVKGLWDLEPDGLRAAKREIVRLLIEKGADLHNKGGNPPLSEALLGGDLEVIKLLLEKGADPNHRENASTPLGAAVLAGGSKELIQLLLDAGADPLKPGGVLGPQSATELAAMLGAAEHFTLLLSVIEEGSMKPEDEAAIMLAAAKHPRCLKLALERGFDPNLQDKDGITPLHSAAHFIESECLNLLLEAGADVHAKDKEGYTPLHNAAERGRAAHLPILLKHGARIEETTTNGFTALISASSPGSNAETVKILLEAGAKVDVGIESEHNPLIVWSGRGNVEAVTHLLEAGANPTTTTKSSTPLGAAAAAMSKEQPWPAREADYLEIARLLIDKGAEVDAHGTEDGYLTALNYALRSPSTKMVELLLEAGADPHAKQKSVLNRTPIWSAIASGNPGMVQLLIDRKVDVNSPDTNGLTPLHFACGFNHPEIARLLIRNGAKLNARNDKDATPLFHAVHHDAVDCIKVLLEAGADKSLAARVAFQRVTPLRYAELHEKLQIVRLLE